MLRGTRENISSRALICNCAGVIALCFLLLASVVAIPLGNLHGALFTPVYAQETEGEEAATAEQQATQTEALGTLQRIAELGEITDLEGLSEVAGASDPEELAELVGASDVEGLEDLVIPRPNPTDPPTTEEPPAAGGGSGEEPPAAGEEDPNSTDEGGVDKWGVEELYSTAGGGPTWYIREQTDPTADGHFYYGMYEGTTIDYQGSGVWTVDARSGTQEHGIRMHVDSPDGVWKNTEISGYFNVQTGDDQITMIARHGPSYHDNGGCQAYGYYGMTAVDGNVFFKKKLYHFDGGYTQRVAQVDALDNILNEWIGMKFVVYDIAGGAVKLELWIDEGDMTNNWQKVTELVDDGGLSVEGGADCGRESDHIIEDGTRVSYRVDDSLFDFKKLSVREIQP